MENNRELDLEEKQNAELMKMALFVLKRMDNTLSNVDTKLSKFLSLFDKPEFISQILDETIIIPPIQNGWGASFHNEAEASQSKNPTTLEGEINSFYVSQTPSSNKVTYTQTKVGYNGNKKYKYSQVTNYEESKFGDDPYVVSRITTRPRKIGLKGRGIRLGYRKRLYAGKMRSYKNRKNYLNLNKGGYKK